MGQVTENEVESGTAQRPRSWWWRVTRAIGVVMLVVIGVLVGLYFYDQARSASRVRGFMAELDENDKGWRIEDLDQARTMPRPGRNSALLVNQLSALLTRWPDSKYSEIDFRTTPPELLDSARLKILEEQLALVDSVSKAAKPLADMPVGRYEYELGPNPMTMNLEFAQRSRNLFRLLEFESQYLANKGKINEALHSNRSCICAARSHYDEPFTICALIRVAGVTIGLQGVERTLWLGEASDGELAKLASLLEDEEKHNSMLVAIRGERALLHQLFTKAAAGTLPPEELLRGMGAGEGMLAKLLLVPRWQFRRQHPIVMDYMTKMVEIAKKPVVQQAELFRKLDIELKNKMWSAPLVGMLVPAMGRAMETGNRKTAMVASMRTLIAAERYRMKQGKMPGKLEDLVPEYLKMVPEDPFDGKPLKLAKQPDGLIIYSVGQDGKDNGGTISRVKPYGPGMDVGYQLWDVKARRKAASPWTPEKKEP